MSDLKRFFLNKTENPEAREEKIDVYLFKFSKDSKITWSQKTNYRLETTFQDLLAIESWYR